VRASARFFVESDWLNHWCALAEVNAEMVRERLGI
jgi:hypothetical protein